MRLSTPLLQVDDMVVHYPIESENFFGRNRFFKAVSGVSFDLNHGEILGLVGESGCGKSTLARTLLRLVEPSAGKIVFNGENLVGLPPKILRRTRQKIQMIFQDPLASLNPRMTVGTIIAEPLGVYHKHLSRMEIRKQVRIMMDRVGLSPDQINRYPHQFSGGQCQRIGIARALILQPDLVVCDEPVSALDVSIQAQIINLLVDLQREMGLSLLFISHDLSIVKQISDRIMVMYLGKLVEINEANALYRMPKHPYTRALIQAIPIPDPKRAGNRPHQTLSGEIPSPLNPPNACTFHPRCPHVMAQCRQEIPILKVPYDSDRGLVACHLV